MKRKDRRLSSVSEVLQGIRIVKMLAWERDFMAKASLPMALELFVMMLQGAWV